ncbi:MAG: hypothetical protein GWN58_25745 [Anaerolineae bacterium]|nr:hypothetical protein [Anaerolineae bacterium]
MPLEIWVNGKHCPDAALVHVKEGRNHLEEDWAEPIDLDGVDAALRFVQAHHPRWRVEDGEVVSACEQSFEFAYCPECGRTSLFSEHGPSPPGTGLRRRCYYCGKSWRVVLESDSLC